MANILQSCRMSLKVCSININGLSSNSKLLLEKYSNDNCFDIIAVQETLNSYATLNNMERVSDENSASNRGSALFVNMNKLSYVKLSNISSMFHNID